MAGAGYKLFQTGDVLTAAQVNTYLNEQTVMVFANAAARTSALTSVLAEGMMSYLQDTNAVEVYNGTAWVGVGNVGDITEVQAGVGISVASGTGPIPVITNSSTDLITTAGDLLYGTAADTVARLGIGTAGQVLKVNSGATAPEWGTVATTSLPAFSAYGTTNQTATVNVFTKITFNAETFDTASNFDTANSRFLPTTSGYYQINGTLDMDTTSSGQHILAIYKNGSLDKYLSIATFSGESLSSGSAVIFLNGSSDYVELYAKGSAGTVTLYAGVTVTHFTGVGVRV